MTHELTHYKGRIPSPPDDRDYPVARLLRAEPPLGVDEMKYKVWYNDVWQGDQGRTNQCTAYAMLHLLHDGPFTHRPYWVEDPLVLARDLYCDAQTRDPWGGSYCAGNRADDGTTMRAICEATRHRGLIGNYYFIRTFDELLTYLTRKGPVLAGTWWYSGMERMWPADHNANVEVVRVTGRQTGGHATKWDGIHWREELLRIKNSWRDMTEFWISFKDAERLLREDGEFIAITERRVA